VDGCECAGSGQLCRRPGLRCSACRWQRAWADRSGQLDRLAVALVQRRPRPGHAPLPSWPWCAQGRSLARGRLAEVAAHLAVAETHAETVPPDRQRRLRATGL